jgi:hypothetical protein
MLVRALAGAGALPESEELLGQLRQYLDSPSVRVAQAVVADTKGNRQETLEILQSLRRDWPARFFGLLTYEMVVAASLRDLASFRDAYVDRCAVEGRQPWRWLPRFWLRLRLWIGILLLIWGVGVVFGQTWLWALGEVAFMGYLGIHWHVLRSPRLARRNALLLLVATCVAGAATFLYGVVY